MSTAYNNLVSVISKPLTVTSVLPIPSVTMTNNLLPTQVSPTPSVNTSLLVTRSGYTFPDIPDPLGIIETMIGAEWYDKSYRTRVEGYKGIFSPRIYIYYYTTMIKFIYYIYVNQPRLY